MPTDLLGLLDRPGRCSGSRPQDSMVRSPAALSPVLFSGLLFAGSGRRWSSGGRGDREMMMMTSASPVRGRPRIRRRGERSELPGHRQRSPNSAALTLGRSASLSPGCGGRCSERSAEFGSDYHVRCPNARAQGWAARCQPTCLTCSIGLVGAAAAGRRIRW